MNAVIYRTTKEELAATDKRELNYKREQVPVEAINDYVSVLPKNAKVWVYLNKFTTEEPMEKAFPTKEFPIVQSYVDICINGCLEMEARYPEAKKKQFAKDFLTTTYHWSSFWVNDRVYPRRPFIFRPNAYDIDALIKEYLPAIVRGDSSSHSTEIGDCLAQGFNFWHVGVNSKRGNKSLQQEFIGITGFLNSSQEKDLA